ncbi:MAG: hypothetical protein HYW02_04490 [Deltaproteobacteria bacterium]|nr:hypothetical protein [Deltaproteobacteria bacterium]
MDGFSEWNRIDEKERVKLLHFAVVANNLKERIKIKEHPDIIRLKMRVRAAVEKMFDAGSKKEGTFDQETVERVTDFLMKQNAPVEALELVSDVAAEKLRPEELKEKLAKYGSWALNIFFMKEMIWSFLADTSVGKKVRLDRAERWLQQRWAGKSGLGRFLTGVRPPPGLAAHENAAKLGGLFIRPDHPVLDPAVQADPVRLHAAFRDLVFENINLECDVKRQPRPGEVEPRTLKSRQQAARKYATAAIRGEPPASPEALSYDLRGQSRPGETVVAPEILKARSKIAKQQLAAMTRGAPLSPVAVPSVTTTPAPSAPATPETPVVSDPAATSATTRVPGASATSSGGRASAAVSGDIGTPPPPPASPPSPPETTVLGERSGVIELPEAPPPTEPPAGARAPSGRAVALAQASSLVAWVVLFRGAHIAVDFLATSPESREKGHTAIDYVGGVGGTGLLFYLSATSKSLLPLGVGLAGIGWRSVADDVSDWFSVGGWEKPSGWKGVAFEAGLDVASLGAGALSIGSVSAANAAAVAAGTAEGSFLIGGASATVGAGAAPFAGAIIAGFGIGYAIGTGGVKAAEALGFDPIGWTERNVFGRLFGTPRAKYSEGTATTPGTRVTVDASGNPTGSQSYTQLEFKGDLVRDDNEVKMVDAKSGQDIGWSFLNPDRVKFKKFEMPKLGDDGKPVRLKDKQGNFIQAKGKDNKLMTDGEGRPIYETEKTEKPIEVSAFERNMKILEEVYLNNGKANEEGQYVITDNGPEKVPEGKTPTKDAKKLLGKEAYAFALDRYMRRLNKWTEDHHGNTTEGHKLILKLLDTKMREIRLPGSDQVINAHDTVKATESKKKGSGGGGGKPRPAGGEEWTN